MAGRRLSHGVAVTTKPDRFADHLLLTVNQECTGKTDYAIHLVICLGEARIGNSQVSAAVSQGAKSHFACHFLTGQAKFFYSSKTYSQNFIFGLWGIYDIAAIEHRTTSRYGCNLGCHQPSGTGLRSGYPELAI